MKHTFALTTRQVAKLAGVEPPPIYMSVKGYGNWRGITPRKTNSGRLLWRSDEVHAALGIVPDPANMTNAERFYCQFLEDEALPVTGEAWAIGEALLSPKYDEGRDPDLYLNDAVMALEIVSALAERLDSALPIMWAGNKARTMACLAEISRIAASFSEAEKNHG